MLSRYLGRTVAAILMAAAATFAWAGPAQASGCPSGDQTVVNASDREPPYMCAIHNWSSKKSIQAWETKTWSSTVANTTEIKYRVRSKCRYKSSGDITHSYVDEFDSYFSATFTNWNTGKRHFGTGVVFVAPKSHDGGQYDDKKNCANSDGKIRNSILKITKKVTVDSVTPAQDGKVIIFRGTVSPSSAPGNVGLFEGSGKNGTQQFYEDGRPVGGQVKDGGYEILWPIPPGRAGTLQMTVAYAGDATGCPAPAKSCGYSKLESNEVAVKLPTSTAIRGIGYEGIATLLSEGSGSRTLYAKAPGTTPRVRSNPGLTTLSRSRRIPARLALQCPGKSVPFHAELFGADSGRSLAFSSRGARLKPGAVRNGRRAMLQLTCRKKRGKSLARGRLALGTERKDRLVSRKAGMKLFGGPGGDRIRVRHLKGIAFGGLGNDRIVLSQAGAVAIGGPGNDRIWTRHSGRSLIIGGPGRDVIQAGGRARVDVRDGERDRVYCKGSRVEVKADEADLLIGDCRRK